MTLTLISIAILLVFSAFFSGSETALTAASRPLMHQLASQGNKRAALVNRLHSRKDRLIGAILLGNNLVNIFASALATSALIALAGEAGVVYATLGMTVLVLIFAEVLPKSFAFRNPNRMALLSAPVIHPLVVVFAPLTIAIQVVVNGTLRIFGLHKVKASSGFNAQELRGAIDLLQDKEYEAEHSRAMLRSVLDLGEVQVEEIMTHRKSVVMIDADARPSQIVEQVLASPYTRIPLWRGNPDNIVGVLHAKALLRAVRQSNNLDDLNVLKVAAKPWFIPEYTLLLDQLQAFRRRREHFALVVDEYGAFLGVVTLEDILEEIVGEIDDEHDVTVEGVVPQGDGSYLVDGTVTIRDLNRQFGWRLPDDEASTVAGLVLYESRRIPEVGQAFRFHGFRFEIVNRQRNQIRSLRISRQEKQPRPTDKPAKA